MKMTLEHLAIINEVDDDVRNYYGVDESYLKEICEKNALNFEITNGVLEKSMTSGMYKISLVLPLFVGYEPEPLKTVCEFCWFDHTCSKCGSTSGSLRPTTHGKKVAFIHHRDRKDNQDLIKFLKTERGIEMVDGVWTKTKRSEES